MKPNSKIKVDFIVCFSDNTWKFHSMFMEEEEIKSLKSEALIEKAKADKFFPSGDVIHIGIFQLLDPPIFQHSGITPEEKLKAMRQYIQLLKDQRDMEATKPAYPNIKPVSPSNPMVPPMVPNDGLHFVMYGAPPQMGGPEYNIQNDVNESNETSDTKE